MRSTRSRGASSRSRSSSDGRPGRSLQRTVELGEHAQETDAAEEPLGEDEILELVKETFDARELNEGEDA